MSPEVMTEFLDAAIRDRINVRLLAEEHIAISRALDEENRVDNFIGVIHTKCSPAEVIQVVGSFVSDLCEATLGASPKIEMNGHLDATFALVDNQTAVRIALTSTQIYSSSPSVHDD
jgi:26S proteasome regulatory subunit T1